MNYYDVVIVGGGFFGCSLAIHLKQPKNNVLLLEKEPDIMLRASYNNQARVHGGYHYTRSLLTALRSRINFADFVKEYESCVDSSFTKYYAVAKQFSKISARHFYQFSKRIGAEVAFAPKAVKKYFNDDLIEDVFTVREYAFNSLKLRELVKEQLFAREIICQLHSEAETVLYDGNNILLSVKDVATGEQKTIQTKQLFNCAYSRINKLHTESCLPLIPLKHELTEMALIEVPDELRNLGITVMDGPFFSVMPFPPRALHTFSHVRYTPHVEWRDNSAAAWRDGHIYLNDRTVPTAFHKMLADAKRYIPLLSQAKHIDSLWEVKTVLPASEQDDSRPILFAKNYGGIPGYTCIMGGKIDNVQDVLREVDAEYGA